RARACNAGHQLRAARRGPRAHRALPAVRPLARNRRHWTARPRPCGRRGHAHGRSIRGIPMARLTALLTGIALAFVSLAGQGHVFQLKLGDCFTGAASGNVSDVTTVACSQPHDAEVYSVFTYPNAPSDYPGDDAVKSTAETGCTPAFKDFVGIDYNSSNYGISFL